MKRLSYAFGIFLCISFILTACSGQGGSSSTSSSQESSQSSSKSEESLGSRKKPASIGETLHLEDSEWCKYDITLTELIRGEDAWSIIYEANPFNDPPADGNEFILAKFKAKNTEDLSGKDEPLKVMGLYFKFADSTYAMSDYKVQLVSMPNKLNSELYEGAETEGYVLFECKAGDNPYAVWVGEKWFKLYE